MNSSNRRSPPHLPRAPLHSWCPRTYRPSGRRNDDRVPQEERRPGAAGGTTTGSRRRNDDRGPAGGAVNGSRVRDVVRPPTLGRPVSRKSGPVSRPGTGGLCGRSRGYRHRTQYAPNRACRSLCSPVCVDGHGPQGASAVDTVRASCAKESARARAHPHRATRRAIEVVGTPAKRFPIDVSPMNVFRRRSAVPGRRIEGTPAGRLLAIPLARRTSQ